METTPQTIDFYIQSAVLETKTTPITEAFTGTPVTPFRTLCTPSQSNETQQLPVDFVFERVESCGKK